MSPSSPFSCGNKEALVAYLYGECDGAERDSLEAHLLTCLTCATELRSLRGVSAALAEWKPPEADLGFRIVPDAEAVKPRWFWPVPVWAQAAAMALLVLSGAAAIANVEVHYGSEGLTVRTGWTHAQTPVSASGAPVPGTEAWRSELIALRDEVRRELAARPTAAVAPLRSSVATADPELLRRVNKLLDDSERRQRNELALRVAELTRDLNFQRRSDLMRISQNFGEMQGETGAAIRRAQRDWADYVVRTSQRPPQ